MNEIKVRISLKAARVNAELSQGQVAKMLATYFGQTISRQRIARFESNPEDVPPAFGEALAKLYGIPEDFIKFAHESTLSYTKKEELLYEPNYSV